MKKFHVNPETGEVGKCSASKRACPLGESSLHFESESLAKQASEKMLSQRFETEKPKGKLIVYVGLPGSGKSTLAAEKVKETGGVELNRDDKRTELYGEDYHKSAPVAKNEAAINAILHNKMVSVLRSGGTVIDSNTNTNKRFLAAMISQAKSLGADIEIIHVDVPIEEAKRRNALRGEQGGRFVPEAVIDSMAKNLYENGKMKEVIFGEKGLFFVAKDTPGQKLVEDYSKKLEERYPILNERIAIVDIDGTLSFNSELIEEHVTNVQPGEKKDWNGFYRKSRTAPVNQSVLQLVKRLRKDGISVFAITGRQDSVAEDTIEFLERTEAPISRLLMPRKGDFRGDYECKKAIAENLLSEGFTIVHSIDDRDTSIEVWNELGVPVSKVPAAKKVNGVFVEPVVVENR